MSNNMLGDLVMKAVKENRDEVSVAEVAATQRSDMTKDEFLDKVNDFATTMDVDMKVGYAVINPSTLPEGVELSHLSDRVFVSDRIPAGSVVFVKKALTA